jgi:phospholipid/cholesterol/gamma-HCH transport system substrate-binding protein
VTAARRLAAALVAVLLVAPGCGLVGGGSDGYTLTVQFERAVSLYPQSEIRILGLPAGRVTSVDADGAIVEVELAIDGDVPVPADVSAALVPQSLIGERYVQLFPAWTKGDPKIEDGAVIPIERTIVPVEPDEALAAVKEFLDALDPDGVGRLIKNAADDLEGNGAQLGESLESLTGLVELLERKDDVLVSIMENLDEFSTTLLTREEQIGEVMDLFADTTATLAAERQTIEQLVAGLARASTAGLDLVSENSAKLQKELDILGRTLRTVEANLGAVDDLLTAGPILVTGLDRAYDPEKNRLELRQAFTPLVSQALDTALRPLGLDIGPGICVPADVTCEAGAGATEPPDPGEAVGTRSAVPEATRTSIAPARTPVDDIVELFEQPGVPTVAQPEPSLAERVAGTAGGAGGALRRAAATLLGALG